MGCPVSKIGCLYSRDLRLGFSTPITMTSLPFPPRVTNLPDSLSNLINRHCSLDHCPTPKAYDKYSLSRTSRNCRLAVIMSAEYEGQDPLAIAEQAERDLNSHAAKHGHGGSQSGTNISSPIRPYCLSRQHCITSTCSSS